MVGDAGKGFAAEGTNSSLVIAATCRWKVVEGVHFGQFLSLVSQGLCSRVMKISVDRYWFLW